MNARAAFFEGNALSLGDSRCVPSEFVGGALGELWQLVKKLVGEYPWSMGDATHFVLRGEDPPVHLVRSRTTRSDVPTEAQRVVLVIDPSRSESEVISAYTRARKSLAGIPVYSTEREQALAAFLLTQPRTIPWSELHSRWNAGNGAWRIENESNLRRDAMAAFKKVFPGEKAPTRTHVQR